MKICFNKKLSKDLDSGFIKMIWNESNETI